MGTYINLETSLDPGSQDRSVLKAVSCLLVINCFSPEKPPAPFLAMGYMTKIYPPDTRTKYKDEGPGQVVRFGVWPGGWNPRIMVNS